ncbi:MAG: hypothetical protein RLZZ597_2572 [Cyanobacteriota bacterium]|jgi:hypothetical protein
MPPMAGAEGAVGASVAVAVAGVARSSRTVMIARA